MMPAARAALLLASLGRASEGLSTSWKRPTVVVEGAAVVRELSQDVLNNGQEVLRIPWIISRTRDIGYVGEFWLTNESRPYFKQESLQTGRESEGFTPHVILGTLVLPSGQPAAPMSKYRMGGVVAGESVKHLNGVVSPSAELTVWQYQRNRMNSFFDYLEQYLDTHQDKLVILHSHGDVLFGGCSENIIKYKYEQIIKANNNDNQSIVLAAEVSPYPEDLGWKYSRESWTDSRRAAVLSAFGMAEDWATTYASCSNTTNSRCNSPPKYQFVNSGFMMGPAWTLRDMLAEIRTYTDIENRWINEYFLRNPSKVALDYAGSLVVSLHNFVKSGAPGPVEIRNGTNVQNVSAGGDENELVSVTTPTWHLFNRATGSDVCFVHGNGNSFDAVKGLAETLAAYTSETD